MGSLCRFAPVTVQDECGKSLPNSGGNTDSRRKISRLIPLSNSEDCRGFFYR